jgi:hypothetical protein
LFTVDTCGCEKQLKGYFYREWAMIGRQPNKERPEGR